MKDCHIHTRFSPDSESEPEEVIEAAVKAGLDGVIFTEHFEADVEAFQFTPLDPDAYFKKIEAVKKSAPISVKIGVEVGFDPLYIKEICALLDSYPFEYIINSVHNIRGLNPYLQGFVYDDGKNTVYNRYLKLISESLDVPYRVDCIGHIGYIERCAPYEDKVMDYAQFRPLMDEIIQKAIKRGVIIELNTNSAELSQPRADFLTAYYAAGGRKVALSSDAHIPDRVGHNFTAAAELLKNMGFTID